MRVIKMYSYAVIEVLAIHIVLWWCLGEAATLSAHLEDRALGSQRDVVEKDVGFDR